jgi:hypothetical protein
LYAMSRIQLRISVERPVVQSGAESSFHCMSSDQKQSW